VLLNPLRILASTVGLHEKNKSDMRKNSFLKDQLNDFVDVYKKYLFKTSGLTVALSVIILITVAILLKYSDFDSSSTRKQISLLSYFFLKYSSKDTYSLVDLSKNVFIFFMSIFSILMIRFSKTQKDSGDIKLSNLMSNIDFMDFIYLLCVLIFCSIIDYFLFQLDTFSVKNIVNQSLNTWTHNVDLYLLRVYIPLILFSIAIKKIVTENKRKITFINICQLCVSIWIINEFMYEFFSFIRLYLFGFILAPFEQDNKFIYESVFGVILIAFSFLGYYSGMTKSLLSSDDIDL